MSTQEDTSESVEPDEEIGTPHSYISESLHEQRTRARSSAVETLMDEFGLEQFDAETLASAAADLSQIKDAVKRVRRRRYGNIVVKYIELDIVTWRILPSPENVRFEESRVRDTDGKARFRSLDSSSPVLVFEGGSSTALTTRLENEAEEIWLTNEHASTIPDRGIENPGLLSIARISTDDRETVGILDATDGFGRTVGAHKALEISAGDALWKYSRPDDDQLLRSELMSLRTNPHDEDDPIGLHLSIKNRRRLRGSVMQRAQVIVGFEFSAGSSAGTQDFAQVRRTLVGHIHIEPPKPFTLGTQYALKATAAMQALEAQDALPEVGGFSSLEVAESVFNHSEIVAAQPTELSDGRSALVPDEVFVLALAALRATTGRNDRRARITNAAIRELTGQSPSKNDRSMLAADLALRLGELAAGNKANDVSYDSRRSSVDRSIRAKLLDSIRLTREPISDVLAMSLLELDESRDSSKEPAARPFTAELVGLSLYHLVGKPGRRLIERATKKDPVTGDYISEPNVVVEALAESRDGLMQLAQAIIDGRAGRQPQVLPEGAEPSNKLFQDGTLLDATILRTLAGHSGVDDSMPESPVQSLNSHIVALKQDIRNVQERVQAVGSIASDVVPDSPMLVALRGAAVREQSDALQDIAFTLRSWDETMRRHAETAEAAFAAADSAALETAE